MDYLTIFGFLSDTDLQKRIVVALLRVALAKRAQVGVPQKQLDWAKAMLTNQNSLRATSLEAVPYVVSDTGFLTANGTITDNQLQLIVNNWLENVYLPS